MPVNNPVAVNFCNKRVRVAANIICRALGAASAIVNEFSVKNIASLIPDDPMQVVEDGAPADGRNQITGADVHRVIEALTAVVTTLQGVASNGKTHYENALKVADEPTPPMGVQL